VSETTPASSPIAGENALLASRYVGALLGLAEQEGATDAVAADMLNLRVLWNESPEMRSISTNPRFSIEFLHAAAEQVAKGVRAHKLTENFLSILAQYRRLYLLPALVDAFMDEMAKVRGEYKADVRSAHPLTEPQKAQLIASLSEATGGKINLVTTEDPSLIGGLTVKIGSKFLDASVKTKIDHLEHILTEKNAAA
jgi:F-type H+-transporting ATPase subunit delta